MNDQNMTTKKALLVVGFFIFLLMITLVAPAKWVGVKSKKQAGLVLRNSNDFAVLSKDTNRNNNPDWKDLLMETTNASTTNAANKYVVTEADKKRLEDPNNLTASFSKNLYTVSAYAMKKGDMSIAEQEAIVSSLVTKEAEKVEVTVYSTDNLKTLTTDTFAVKKTYGNQLGVIFKKAIDFNLDSIDLDKLQAYSISKNPEVLATVVIKKNNSKIILDELLKVSVPRSAAPYHLLMVNRLSEYISVLEGITQVESDPMRSTIAFNKYAQTIKALSSSLANLQLYFKFEDVTFTSNESGYVLNPVYTTN